MNLHIGQRISFLRKKGKLTQEELAKMLHTSRSHLANIEGGRHSLQAEHLTSCSQIFQVQPIYLQHEEICEQSHATLEILFSRLINGTLELAECIISQLKETSHSLEKEASEILLKAIFYYKSNRVENLLDYHTYINHFFTENRLHNLSGSIKKYYLLYLVEVYKHKGEYEKSLSYHEYLLSELKPTSL